MDAYKRASPKPPRTTLPDQWPHSTPGYTSRGDDSTDSPDMRSVQREQCPDSIVGQGCARCPPGGCVSHSQPLSYATHATPGSPSSHVRISNRIAAPSSSPLTDTTPMFSRLTGLR